MNQKLIKSFTSLTLLIAIYLPVQSEAANQTKVFIGVGLIAGGAAVTAHGLRFCLSDCGNQTTEAVAGLAMIGVGTFLLIKGAREHSLNLTTKTTEQPRTTILIGAVPMKHGVAGAAQIKW